MRYGLETLYDNGARNPEIPADISSLCTVVFFELQFYDIIPAPIARSVRPVPLLRQLAVNPSFQRRLCPVDMY